MSDLEQIILTEIAHTGPISTARFMELCLSHPQHGYYATRDPLGASGDFTTAPEISQMFGEMIGVWVASVWASMDQPAFNLVELGPGRGTLMTDVRRVLNQTGALPEIWFVETSPALRKQQAMRVPDANWVETLADVPQGPMILLANEFLDALPVYQYLQTPEGWREQRVGQADGALTFGLSQVVPDRQTPKNWFEVSPLADSITGEIGARLRTSPGAALLIDYGYDQTDAPEGLTLQALRKHKHVSPLHLPGECDLTWLIDFDRVEHQMGQSGARCDVSEQGAFLGQMGIGPRAQSLASASPDKIDTIADALERLTSPDQMGKLFKVLGACSPGLPQPPGFEG